MGARAEYHQDTTMFRIDASKLRAGDVVDDHGELHRIEHIDRRAGWAWPIAFDDHGWAIAIGDDSVSVERTGSRVDV
jgi:hypothetical protein